MKDKFMNTSMNDVSGKGRARGSPSPASTEAFNHEHERIQKWLKQVRFKKKFFGGVSEKDLWKKLADLNSIYEAALSAERARYDALREAELTAEKARHEAELEAAVSAERERTEKLLSERCGPAEPGKAGDDTSG